MTLCQRVAAAAFSSTEEEGLVLVAHKPDTNVVAAPTGSHVRGSPLKAAAGRGDDEQEIDLLLPGTARFSLFESFIYNHTIHSHRHVYLSM